MGLKQEQKLELNDVEKQKYMYQARRVGGRWGNGKQQQEN